MSGGLTARLRAPLQRPAEFGEVLAGAWSGLTSAELARRPVGTWPAAVGAAGDLFEVTGDLRRAHPIRGRSRSVGRVGAGLAEGDVVVDGQRRRRGGTGHGGRVDRRGEMPAPAGAAAHEARRGMTAASWSCAARWPGRAARECGGASCNRSSAGAHTGVGMIAGTVVVFGDGGLARPLVEARSIVALGNATIPTTLSIRVHLPAGLPHTHARALRRSATILQNWRATPPLWGTSRRYSKTNLGKGEILAWTGGKTLSMNELVSGDRGAWRSMRRCFARRSTR